MFTRRATLLLLVAAGCRQEKQADPATWELVVTFPVSTVAGEDTAYTVSALSSEGDTAAVDDWTLSSDTESGLDWNDATFRPIKAGTQQLTVTALVDGEEQTQTAEVSVNPGAATSISLTLESRSGSYEVGDSVLADVSIQDAYNNETRDPWSLTVEGGDAAVDGTTITFDTDGLYTVTATVTGTEISDSEGPILVDSTAPVFTMDFPEHVDHTTSALQKVKGNVVDNLSGLAWATLDAEALPLDDKGDFTKFHSWDLGVNVITLAAMDNDGNSVEQMDTVFCGDLLSDDEVVPDGMVVHLGTGSGGLDEIIDLMDAEVDTIDITSSLPIDITGSKYDVAIVDVDYRFDGIEIDPEDGKLVVTASISKIEVDIEGEVKAVFWIDATGKVDVDSVAVQMDMTPYVTSSGRLSVTVGDTKVAVTGLNMDFESSLYEVVSAIGLDTVLENYVTTLLEDQIATQVQTAAREQLESALSSLVLDQTVTIMDNTYALEGSFSSVDVDSSGVTVGMDVDITPDAAYDTPWMDGSLYAGYAPPDMDALSGLSAGINLDLMNRVLYLAWAEGALDQSLTGEQVGLSSDALAFVFPNATSVTFSTEAMMPPVVLPGDMLTPMEAQLGALRLNVVDQDNATLLDIMVGVTMDVDLDTDGTTLTPSLTLVGDPWIEITDVSEQSTGIINYEALVALLLPQIVDSMTSALQAVSLPTVSGGSLTVDRIIPYGDDGGYLTAMGTLEL